MSYDVQIFRKETMQREKQSNNEDFFDDKDNLEPFTQGQREKLHERLLTYDFEVTRQEGNMTHYEEEEIGMMAMLTERGLYFQASSGDCIFEISMVASEFTDDEDFVKYDPQADGWEEF